MASNARSREPVRDELTAKLASALVGTGKPVQAVYGYRVFDFAGQSPVVVVAPAGVTRVQTAMNTSKRQVNFDFDVFVFVVVSDVANGVTESMSDDSIDAIEKLIADCVQDNVQNLSPSIAGGDWNLLYTRGPSRDDSIEIQSAGNVGGVAYKRCVIPITAELLDA